MNTLMQIGPMVMVEGNGNHQMAMHHHFPHASQQMQQQQPQQPPMPNSMNRSQRCGVCRGCQCKPCGQCTYCQDSPQFGGPGVKKQSCIERRCLRVLENRLQRDAPTFKARVGCNQCEDCRMADCQICLVCLDKRFFENRYMRGAMCAKKRCNNATSIELPAHTTPPAHDFQRQAPKRSYEQMAPQPPMHFEMKRRLDMQYMGMPQPPPPTQQQQVPPQSQPTPQQQQRLPPSAPQQMTPQQSQQQPPQAQQVPPPQMHLQEMGNARMMLNANYPVPNEMNNRMVSLMGAQMPSTAMPQPCQPPNLEIPTYLLPGFAPSGPDFYSTKAYNLEEFEHNGDPFIPPSYAPEMKNAVVLQQL
ncbi:unnamed protein product [Caenorhabditis auriculariae]|uniref:CXXC-type domain-containing protein n=1 Tax=Caenorhabditis auriculariae TaxID=2777116 RepID=A0A8S1GZE8_9PELO|nr:unnamed protein product [Caenorhabditis auriculariae]